MRADPWLLLAATVTTGVVVSAPLAWAQSTEGQPMQIGHAAVRTAATAVPLELPVVLSNQHDGAFCSPIAVSVRYSVNGARSAYVTTQLQPSAGPEPALLAIPASALRPGHLTYSISARQHCGIVGRTHDYGGRAPATGEYTVRLAGP